MIFLKPAQQINRVQRELSCESSRDTSTRCRLLSMTILEDLKSRMATSYKTKKCGSYYHLYVNNFHYLWLLQHSLLGSITTIKSFLSKLSLFFSKSSDYL